MQRHTWARRAPSRRMTLGGLTTLATLLAATPAAATLSDVPSVMVDEINWVAGWFDAFDKPDFFARVRLKDALGNIVECGTTPVTQDLLYASPGTVLCNDPRQPHSRARQDLASVLDPRRGVGGGRPWESTRDHAVRARRPQLGARPNVR